MNTVMNINTINTINTRTLTFSVVAASLLLVSSACGGGQKKKASVDDLDETTTKPVTSGDGTTPTTTADGDNNPGDGDTSDPTIEPDAGVPAPAGPAVTINIKNTWDKDLEFNLDAGWGGQILVFSGKPPKAKSILPFAKPCTASCDADAKDRCPVCKKPKSLGAIRKAEKRETVAAGKDISVEWDGQVHVYEKTKGKGRSCDCHRLEPAPEGTYTVRVCGLRLSKKHRKHSKLQCVDLTDALVLPGDGPQVLEVDFGNPSKKKKKK